MRRVIDVMGLVCFCAVLAWGQIPLHSPDPSQRLLNEVVDVSGDFRSFTNTYYCADSLVEFDPATGQGKIKYQRYEYTTRQAFDNIVAGRPSVCSALIHAVTATRPKSRGNTAKTS